MISFVVPAHNEAQLLPRTLAGIHAAAQSAARPYEIVVVDDASTDATANVAADGGAQVVSVNRRQIAAARNAGARAAAGEILVFVDADTLVPPETLCAALAALDAGRAGGGARVVFDGPLPPYAAPLLRLILALYRFTGLVPGCFVFCTREAFERAGGFDERVYASEEILFARALRRAGRTVLLRERTITSGRKLRTHHWRELFGTLWRIASRGRAGVQNRELLDVWYAPRRPDPAGDSRPGAPR